MAKQTVNIGVTANDNTGDPLRTAFDKLNDNFDEVYAAGPTGTNIQISDNTVASTNTNGNIDLDPAGTGKVLINGPMDANGVVTLNSTVTGNITPTANITYNIGGASTRYNEIHGNIVHVGPLVLKEVGTQLEIFQADGVTNAILSGNSTTSGSVLNNGNTVVALTQNGPITFYANNYQDGGATVTVINTGNITTPAVIATGAVTGGSLTDGTATVTSGALTGVTTITASGAVTGGSLTDGTATLASGSLTSAVNVTASGTVTGATVTDGTASLASGSLTSAVNVTGSGTVTGGTLTDGTASLTAGSLTSAVNVTGSGTLTGGTLTDGTFSVTSGAVTGATDVETATVTYTGDSTEQSTAYIEHFKFLDANGSAISSTLTDAFGVGLDAPTGKYYEFMAHIIVTNSSTGTVSFKIEADNSGVDDAYIMYTGAAQYGAVTDAKQVTGTAEVTTAFNTADTFHIQLVGSFSTSAITNIKFQVKTTTGTITPLAGSNFRFTEHSANQVGNLS